MVLFGGAGCAKVRFGSGRKAGKERRGGPGVVSLAAVRSGLLWCSRRIRFGFGGSFLFLYFNSRFGSFLGNVNFSFCQFSL